MNALTNHYYGLLRLFLTLIGFWPDIKPRQKLIRTILVNFNIFTLGILQVLNFASAEYQIETFIEILTYFIPYILVTTTYYISYFKQKKAQILLYQIDRDFESEDTEVIEIMKKYAAEGKLYVQLLIISYYGLFLIVYNLPTLSILINIVVPQNKTRTRKTPIPIGCFIDKDKYFYEILFFVHFLVLGTGVLIISMCAIFLMFVQHARGLFHVVGHVLEHAFDYGQRSYSENRDEEIYESFVRIIKFHEKANRFVKTLNSISEFPYLINITLVVGLIAISFVQIFYTYTIMDNEKQLIIPIFYTLTTFIWLFLNCYLGQQLVDQSLAIFEKTCQTPWYLASSRTQKLILIMMMRSANPSCLSVGRMFAISHEFFSRVVQTSLSYATMFYSVQ